MPSFHPPLLPSLTAQEFRLAIAGLLDDAPAAPITSAEHKDRAASLCFYLARLFNRDKLEATTLWERISSGLATAISQVDDGDLDRFVNLCLAHVQAEPRRVAADTEAAEFFAALAEQDESWRLGFLRYLARHDYTVVIHGRRLWESHKERARE